MDCDGNFLCGAFVTASAALLMQWGILEENDAYLYGEKVKAYLRRGARPCRVLTNTPIPGWVRDALPQGQLSPSEADGR